MPRIVAIIPARYESIRFPGKVLADRTGKPLIQHVYERAAQVSCLDEVIIATDNQRIEDAVRAFGGHVIRTRTDHPNGTSRIAEAVESIEADIVVNVQGDEPQLDPALIDRTVQALLDAPDAPMSTLASSFGPGEDQSDPNIVKVVVGDDGRAITFTRSIDKARAKCPPGSEPLKHVGLYVFRRAFLPEYVALPSTPGERAERLEQLRVLEHGRTIVVARGDVHHHGIDTPEQYEQFVAWHAAQAATN